MNSKHVSLRLNKVKEVSFECIPYSIQLATRPGPVRHGPTANPTRFWESNNFFTSGSDELKLCTLADQVVHFTFFSNSKNAKKNSNICTRVPKNFQGWNFLKLLWIMYPGYQIHTLFHRQPFTIVTSLKRSVYNISRFHALFSKFEEYNQTVCWQSCMSCLGAMWRKGRAARGLFVFFYWGFGVLLQLLSVWGLCYATIRLSDLVLIKMLEYHWTENFSWNRRCLSSSCSERSERRVHPQHPPNSHHQTANQHYSTTFFVRNYSIDNFSMNNRKNSEITPILNTCI